MLTPDGGNFRSGYGCPDPDAPVPSALVSTRTPVFIYAADPLSAAGAKAQLMGEPSIELVGPVDLDRARVALVIAEAADGSVAKVARAIQRDGVPQVVLVASRFDEAGVVAAVAAGVTGFLRRAEATSARLVEVIREADRAGCQLPEGLLRRAASVQMHARAVRPGGHQRGCSAGRRRRRSRRSVRATLTGP